MLNPVIPRFFSCRASSPAYRARRIALASLGVLALLLAPYVSLTPNPSVVPELEHALLKLQIHPHEHHQP